jgi:hypothetical protein
VKQADGFQSSAPAKPSTSAPAWRRCTGKRPPAAWTGNHTGRQKAGQRRPQYAHQPGQPGDQAVDLAAVCLAGLLSNDGTEGGAKEGRGGVQQDQGAKGPQPVGARGIPKKPAVAMIAATATVRRRPNVLALTSRNICSKI